ncbi:MAG: hypothetical protein ACLQIB_35785 [Isosphaeraceae bacterium]
MATIRKRAKGRIDQLRPSRFQKRLKEILDLGEDDWNAFLWHARNGFADFEKASGEDPDSPLRLREVPPEWLDDPVAMGHVMVRVARDGKPELAAPVAWYFLQLDNPEDLDSQDALGMGVAWLALAREGLDPPTEKTRLTDHAFLEPREFFTGVSEDGVLPLCRLVLESKGTIEAYDLHTLFAALDKARLPQFVPFRLFDSLMAADWITTEVKREFCRGVLEGEPELERLDQVHTALRKAAEPELIRGNLAFLGRLKGGSSVGRRIPGLKRHAVFALVGNVGEPLCDVIEEFLLRPTDDRRAAESESLGALDLIGRHAEELEPEVIRRLLHKAIKHGLAPVRQAAYRIGAERFGLDFARPALKDQAGRVRQWATKVFATHTVRPARKAAHSSTSTSSDQ